jgi:diacylglycerol kinase (ATP)
MRVAPIARVDDGRLDLVTIDEVGWPRALFKIAKLYRGTILYDPSVRHLRTERVQIDAEPLAPVEAEGQLAGWSPAVFSILPGALRVVVPEARAELARDEDVRRTAYS